MHNPVFYRRHIWLVPYAVHEELSDEGGGQLGEADGGKVGELVAGQVLRVELPPDVEKVVDAPASTGLAKKVRTRLRDSPPRPESESRNLGQTF